MSSTTKAMRIKNKKKHDIKVAIWGVIGVVGIFGFSVFLASLGPFIENVTRNIGEQEESSMGIIEDTNLDDIHDDLEELAIEINGQQYVLVDTVMDILRDYTEEE